LNSYLSLISDATKGIFSIPNQVYKNCNIKNLFFGPKGEVFALIELPQNEQFNFSYTMTKSGFNPEFNVDIQENEKRYLLYNFLENEFIELGNQEIIEIKFFDSCVLGIFFNNQENEVLDIKNRTFLSRYDEDLISKIGFNIDTNLQSSKNGKSYKWVRQ